VWTLTAAAQSNTHRQTTSGKASSPESSASQTVAGQKGQPESLFACIMDALSPAERTRHFDELSPMLRRLKTDIRELKDGYEFQFPSDRKTFDLVAEWVIQEKLCCPFFNIDIRIEKEGGPLSMRLTGREGTKEFIRDEFVKWFTP
jgi:hypothetical protein